MRITTIGIIALLVVGCSLGTFGTVQSYFTRTQVSNTSDLSTWHSLLWLQSTQSDFDAGVLSNVNTSAFPGSVILDNETTFPSIYATTGGSTNFLLYNVSNNTWVTMAGTPAAVNAGGGVTYIGYGNISGLCGGGGVNSRAFWIYNISSNTWSTKAPTPANVNRGGTLLDYIGGGNISALSAAALNPTAFWIYNISSNIWSTKASTPADVSTGGGLTYSGRGNISAFAGGGTTTFWQYNITSNIWSAFANVPGNVGAGGALTYDNGNYVYAFKGTVTQNFWRYSISGNSWSAMANILGKDAGGALTYDNGNYIYAFNGTTTPYFFRYDISGNTWSDAAVADPAFNVVAGGSLTFVPGSSVYKPLGTLASQVNDTGKAGTSWNSLIWSGTTVAGVTNITFEVRASDTLFPKSDATPSWISAGWPSPVNTGLPSGRYLQWRATLTTKDPAQTPVLQDVSVWYT